MDPVYLEQQLEKIRNDETITLTYPEFYDNWLPDLDSSEQKEAFMLEADLTFTKRLIENQPYTMQYKQFLDDQGEEVIVNTFDQFRTYFENRYRNFIGSVEYVLNNRKNYVPYLGDHNYNKFILVVYNYLFKRYQSIIKEEGLIAILPNDKPPRDITTSTLLIFKSGF